ncbi:hypothetical protein CASFOL_036163 [Castilleja foliolosa]|uniref:DNA helicase Pif1-like 2B domain-containing protein n=1 Tax=Castilleja foliolosa TaxID=1961234 RepID=A0ABD3BWB3_9LAMI
MSILLCCVWYAERIRPEHQPSNSVYTKYCNQGKITLPRMKTPPPQLLELTSGNGPRSKHFLQNIRSYNSMFAFTSMGGKIDRSVNKGNAPPVFKLYGQNYQLIGGLIPTDGEQPKFAQVYIPVMLLRNIDLGMGLSNGTRLLITRLGLHVLEGRIITGTNSGERVIIPRLSLTPSDVKVPFKFQRRQFPVMISYAMTINKSQDQSLSEVGLYLKQSVFSHGQFYVAVNFQSNESSRIKDSFVW